MATMESMVTAFAGAFRSERLIYRSIEDTDEDRDWLWENQWSNPVSTGLGNLSVFVPASKQQFKKDFENIIKSGILAVFVCLPPKAITDDGETEKEPQPTRIGWISLRKYGLDFKRRTMIGVSIAEPWQNKGYGRESINWALDWAFTWGDMHRVDIGSAAFNERAIALYESIGFKREGVTREVIFFNKQYHDVIDMGMLEHEWEELRGRKESVTKIPHRVE
ncbi:acyl-CoA N-acyltransferase [Xylariales sp. AK1849]|nr:acyl-CoA N-acyltransferase [Xylariales sp. AK1849]